MAPLLQSLDDSKDHTAEMQLLDTHALSLSDLPLGVCESQGPGEMKGASTGAVSPLNAPVLQRVMLEFLYRRVGLWVDVKEARKKPASSGQP